MLGRFINKSKTMLFSKTSQLFVELHRGILQVFMMRKKSLEFAGSVTRNIEE